MKIEKNEKNQNETIVINDIEKKFKESKTTMKIIQIVKMKKWSKPQSKKKKNRSKGEDKEPNVEENV